MRLSLLPQCMLPKTVNCEKIGMEMTRQKDDIGVLQKLYALQV